ncbi:MAG: iron-sulfur cluster assembly protein [bacterium]
MTEPEKKDEERVEATSEEGVDEQLAEKIEGVEAAELTPIETKIIQALQTVYDPEIPVNIYDLGLIYEIHVKEEEKHAFIRMTLTAPGCPVAGTFPDTVRRRVEEVEEIDSAEVDLVFHPPWNPDMMSEEAKLELGFF